MSEDYDDVPRFRTEFWLDGRCFRAFGHPGLAIVTVFKFDEVDEDKRAERERWFAYEYGERIGVEEIVGVDLEQLPARCKIVASALSLEKLITKNLVMPGMEFDR